MAGKCDGRCVLVVDGEPATRTMLRGYLEAEGHRAFLAANGAEALRLAEKHRPGLVLLDLLIPDMNGLDVLARLKESDGSVAVAIMAAHPTVETAVEAMKLGAETVLSKPVSIAELVVTLQAVMDKAERERTREQPRGVGESLRDLMGPSEAIARLSALVEDVAGTNLTVLLYGETGAGKGLVARAIHAASARAAARLVRVDCGAVPDTLIESELFGHERGAFTGAVARNQGYFEAANGGTLFLDEVANLSEAMMRRLLCALEDRQVYRVGGKEPIELDIRVIAASNQNLAQLADSGAFRSDLFHRLNEFAIEIPPLHNRPEDIPYLAQRFLAEANADLHRGAALSPEAAQCLLAHSWPGNARELRNVIKRAVLLCDGTILPEHVQAANAPETTPERETREPPADSVPAHDGQLSLRDITRECIRHIERQVITSVLAATGGNRSMAARILNVNYKTLSGKARDMAPQTTAPRRAATA